MWLRGNRITTEKQCISFGRNVLWIKMINSIKTICETEEDKGENVCVDVYWLGFVCDANRNDFTYSPTYNLPACAQSIIHMHTAHAYNCK